MHALFLSLPEDLALLQNINQRRMQGTYLQELRFNLQSIETLQKAIVSEMLSIQDNPKQKSISENRINNFALMIAQKSKDVLNFIRDQQAMKKEEMMVIQGQKSLKPSDKKKPADVIWQNFYDRAKQIKDQFKKNDSSPPPSTPINTVEYFRSNVFLPPFKQPQFSMEQSKGKYVDMHTIYLQFLSICKVMEESKDTTRLHDYLWFLQHLDRFQQFLINKKFKNQHKYVAYLKGLQDYLMGFLKRSRPLFQIDAFTNSFINIFQQKYAAGKIAGWEPGTVHFDQHKATYCFYCKKLFILEHNYVEHLIGKKHKSLQKQQIQTNPQEQQQARKKYVQEYEKKKKTIAFLQFKISKLREELANVIYDTMNLVRKKQTRGYQQIEENIQEESESEEADAPIYNPKNLPLGWDGKPIPYWLYKLHGLGIQYKCEICGNFSYWGRRAFQMHFQEWRHTYGMKCLKIPNTIHFKDITTIKDALALHQKLTRESYESQFRPDVDQQYEDNQGNVLNKKTYMDMKKQGLIN